LLMMAAMVPVTVPMINRTPTITAFILFELIFYLLLVDIVLLALLRPIYDLTSGTA
jgi:hypothetical protein